LSKFSNYHLSIENSNKVILNIVKYVIEKSDSLMSVINYPKRHTATTQYHHHHDVASSSSPYSTYYPATRHHQRKQSSASSSTTSSQNILGPILNELHQQLVKNDSFTPSRYLPPPPLLPTTTTAATTSSSLLTRFPSTPSTLTSHIEYTNLPKNRYKKFLMSNTNTTDTSLQAPLLLMPTTVASSSSSAAVSQADYAHEQEVDELDDDEDNEEQFINEESKLPRAEYVGASFLRKSKHPQKRTRSRSSSNSSSSNNGETTNALRKQ